MDDETCDWVRGKKFVLPSSKGKKRLPSVLDLHAEDYKKYILKILEVIFMVNRILKCKILV